MPSVYVSLVSTVGSETNKIADLCSRIMHESAEVVKQKCDEYIRDNLHEVMPHLLLAHDSEHPADGPHQIPNRMPVVDKLIQISMES